MTDTTETPADGDRRRAGRPPRQHARKRIRLPNGDELWPRGDLADKLDVNERTVKRMDLPTTYIGNAAYHPHDESLAIVASRIKRPPQRRGAR